jgi:hypothetical protein
MGRNGALIIEEWRPRWSPLWVHSTNSLGAAARETVLVMRGSSLEQADRTVDEQEVAGDHTEAMVPWL